MGNRHLVVGILIGIAIVGCLGAVTDDGDTSSQRYVYQVDFSYSAEIVVLDTQTGTVNHHAGEQTTVYEFYPSAVAE